MMSACSPPCLVVANLEYLGSRGGRTPTPEPAAQAPATDAQPQAAAGAQKALKEAEKVDVLKELKAPDEQA